MSEAFTQAKPSWELTVRDFFVRFKANSETQAEALNLKMPVIKDIQVQPGEQNKSIYASGVVYDVVAQLTESKLGLTAVALPAAFTDRALGTGGKGAVSYDSVTPQTEEFACGYWAENSDGSAVYYFHPRCKLMQSNRTHKTMDQGSLPDPSVAWDIVALPTDEKVWRVRYDTGKVAAGKVPLTPEEFFLLPMDTIENIKAAADKEQDAE